MGQVRESHPILVCVVLLMESIGHCVQMAAHWSPWAITLGWPNLASSRLGILWNMAVFVSAFWSRIGSSGGSLDHTMGHEST